MIALSHPLLCLQKQETRRLWDVWILLELQEGWLVFDRRTCSSFYFDMSALCCGELQLFITRMFSKSCGPGLGLIML